MKTQFVSKKTIYLKLLEKNIKKQPPIFRDNAGYTKAYLKELAYQLKKDGVKLLHFEGRYVPKHRAYFYQVLTGNFTAFHFYIKIAFL